MLADDPAELILAAYLIVEKVLCDGDDPRFDHAPVLPKNYFEDIPELKPAPELLWLAEQILDSKLAAFDPSAFRDRYEEALMAHLKAKQAGLPPQPKQSWAAPRRAINLMEALRRSIAADKPEARRQPAPARKRA